MITPDAAWAVILRHARPLSVIEKNADDALWDFLAEPVVCDRDIPPASRSAMDGYAARSEDVNATPCTLPVVMEVAAGSPADTPLPRGACARIFTGANLPPGADTVVMQEETRPAENRPEAVTILTLAPPGRHVFRQGENARIGQELLAAGARLDPSRLALCAAVGKARVRVHARPRVGVLVTGSELLDASGDALSHQIRDSNGPFLRTALSEHRHPAVAHERVGDAPDALRAALLRLAPQCDVIIMTGGVSVGRYDFTASAVESAGGAIRYHGIAMKPGKPQLFASDVEGRLYFGLPGNPLSAMVGFYDFVLPALNYLAGCPADLCRIARSVRTAVALRGKGDRRIYVPVRLQWSGDGPTAVPAEAVGSADLVAAAHADGVLLIPEGSDGVEAGASLPFRSWRVAL